MRTSGLVKAGAIFLVLRLIGVAIRYLVQPVQPLPTRIAIFVCAALFHAGTVMLIVGLFVALATLRRPLRGVVEVVACLAFLVLTIAGQLDLTLTWITGEPLTPTVFRTFRGFYIVRSSEFLDPIKANLGLAIAGTSMLLTAAAGMLGFVIRDMVRGDAALPSWRLQGRASVAAVLLTVAGAALPWAWATPPVEAAFAREYAGFDDVKPVRPEKDVIASMRNALGLPPGATWISDDYPLVYDPPGAAAARPLSELPDIVVVMIESLRGQEVGYIRSGERSDTPNLDRLASRSVVFSHYISNGFPTAPSIVAFHGASWPHRKKEVVTDFADRHFDELPSRLDDLGYDTRYIGADPRLDKQHLLLPRWYNHAVDLASRHLTNSDQNTVRMAIDDLQLHDRTDPNRPFFAFVSTLSTHYPFNVPLDGEDLAAAPPGETVEGRYHRVLRYTDRAMGRLVEFLDSRPRHHNTVIVVLGDHSFYLDLTKTSGLPDNETQWTTAIVHGPVYLVGRPRRIEEPASHVDIAPTILAMVGDGRPSASLGADLFGPPRSGRRFAVAVRQGGIRLDRGGYAYLVDVRLPTQVQVTPSFPDAKPVSAPEHIDPIEFSDWVAEYSRLIERDRVWSDAFLASESSSVSRR